MKLKIAFVAYVLFSLVAVVVFFTKFQQDEVYTESLEDDLSYARQLNENLTTEQNKLNSELDKKELELDELEGDVSSRDVSIRNLKEKRKEQESRIKQLNQNIDTIEDMMRKGNSDVAAQFDTLIAHLKEEKQMLELQNNQLVDSLFSLGALNDTLTAQSFAFRKQAIDLNYLVDSLRGENDTKDSLINNGELIKDIVENTRIFIEELNPSERLNAKAVRKIKRDKHKEKWKYTSVKFRMNHPREELLLNKQFAFLLLDLDGDAIVEFNEESAYKNNLVLFDYSPEKIIEKYHYNHEKKSGSNYEIQFVLVDGDDIHLLYRGRFSVYQNGERIKP